MVQQAKPDKEASQGTHVRFTVPLAGVRGKDTTVLAIGTLGVTCGLWPRRPVPFNTDRPWHLVAVDDDRGPWHVPAQAHMFEEVGR